MPTLAPYVNTRNPNVIEPGSPRALYDEQQAAIKSKQAGAGMNWDGAGSGASLARGLGGALAQQGQGVAGTQQNTAQGFANQASGFNPQAQSITAAGGMAPQQPSLAQLAGANPSGVQSKGGAVTMLGGGSAAQPQRAGGSSAMASPTFTQALASGAMSGVPGKPAAAAGIGPALPPNMAAALKPAGPAGPPAPPAFQTGQRAAGQNLGSIQDVNSASLGGYGSVMGGLGGAPGAVAGQLGGGYQVGSVGGIAGNLGGAPQVGTVGNIQTGSAPGAVAGNLGTMGQSSGDQQGMMARLNGFLDAPEGASVAEAQLQQAQANNVGQMLGMARSGRGGAGAQAQALAGAMSEGSAIASDTAGQLATLRAQEEDMRKNRALSAIGLGGDMATAARGQDLGYRGQDLSALQGDQSTALGSRGQDIQAAMANQSTQSQLEQLRANTALGARGQDLSALQGDQSTALGLEGLRANTSVATRGQDLSALQGDQSTALGARGQNLQGLTADQSADIAARGQNLSAAQGNQATALGMRGQNVAQEGNVINANTAMRGQDLSAVTGDADRNLAAQQLALQGQLGFGGLQNQATGQGLDYLSQANQQALGAEGIAQQRAIADKQHWLDLTLGNQASDTSRRNTNTMAQAQANSGPSFLESLLPVAGTIGGAILGGPIGAAIGGGIGAAGSKAVGGMSSGSTANIYNPGGLEQNPYG